VGPSEDVAVQPLPLSGGPQVKREIQRQIHAAVGSQLVYWDAAGVEDRPLQIGGMQAKVRYVPTFAFRQLLYDLPGSRSTGCRLCAAPRVADLQLESMSDRGDFRRLFSLRHNNFPYFESQFLVVRRGHRPYFTTDEYRSLLEFLRYSGFESAAMQVAGSGATIPEHAHISVYDERVPIYDLGYRAIARCGGVVISHATNYPGLLIRLTGGPLRARAELISAFSSQFLRDKLSFNLYLTCSASVYLVPRRTEYSAVIDRKMGSVELAGVFLGNALGVTESDVATLQRTIKSRCDAIDARTFQAALLEATCPAQDVSPVQRVLLSLGGRTE
jgi:hypothetical protein